MERKKSFSGRGWIAVTAVANADLDFIGPGVITYLIPREECRSGPFVVICRTGL